MGCASAALPAGMSRSAQSSARGIIVVRTSRRGFIVRWVGWTEAGDNPRRLSDLDCRGQGTRMRRVGLLSFVRSLLRRSKGSAPWARSAWATRRPRSCGASSGPVSAAMIRSRPSGSKTAASRARRAGIGRLTGSMSIASPGSHGNDAASLEFRQHGPLRR